MPVICQICKKEFKHQITNSHLRTHNITTEEYKKTYGGDSLSCKEYKEKLSNLRIGEKNSNYGNKHSNEAKTKISEKRKGKPAYNKGIPMGEEQKKLLSEKAKLRPSTRTNAILTDETKQKISNGIIEYAKNNIEELKQRANKAQATKNKVGGYHEKRSLKILENRKETALSWGYKLLCNKPNFVFECIKCETTFIRYSWYMSHKYMCPTCNVKQSSLSELELRDFVLSLENKTNVLFNDRSVFDNGFEIDILIPSLGIGIEYNGLYWHSELAGKSKQYHITKYLKAKEKGINLIQIFEDEWIYKKEICKERIRQKIKKQDKIFDARKCELQIIDKKIAYNFLNKHHIQGAGYGNILLALMFCNNVVSVMTFSKLNRAKGYTISKENCYELNRYASIGYVRGGASKLFKFFTKHYNPVEVVSYADLRWNTGDLYKLLGFNFSGMTQPNYWYIKGDKRIHRFSLRKNETDNPSLTEWENRKQQGWNRIWDCGHSKWVWIHE